MLWQSLRHAVRYLRRSSRVKGLSIERRELLRVHEQRNVDLPADCMVLAKGVKLITHPEARFGFEHFCWRCPEMTKELLVFLNESYSHLRLLDIGALHGLFSLAFTARNNEARAVAIDPSPAAFNKLLFHVQRNTCCDVLPVLGALSNRNSVIGMSCEWEHAVAETRTTSNSSFHSLTTTGDQLCEDIGFAPDCIKIDVEGHEYAVLQGLSETITRLRPLLFLELHPGMLSRSGASAEDVMDLLKRWNYECLTLEKCEIDWTRISSLPSEIRMICRCRDHSTAETGSLSA